ncbi:hypothetical protein GGER_29460 [Serratia rubidaea]
MHALVTAANPLVRFIGGDVLDDNLRWFNAWQHKLADWQQHTPYLFIHTPDNGDSPQQAQKIWQRLREKLPSLPAAPDWPEQDSLF